MTGLQWRPPQFPKRARIPVYVGGFLCQRSSSNALWYCEQNCSVRFSFQSFLYKIDFIFKRHQKLRQPCSCYSGGSNKISFNIGIFRYFF
ncbi:hypothetical protein M5D96_013476 [Drosophila gunungcola]|uniref:Uncharacterized protein n=1 Tax=Drosophila gunungcola TaxID=103775 RepID=A0A9P9YB83_9MUSC|nr:hypothetical protein M5D96_013476 [Drosophila gunungcola]